jgi:hypothetical protein
MAALTKFQKAFCKAMGAVDEPKPEPDEPEQAGPLTAEQANAMIRKAEDAFFIQFPPQSQYCVPAKMPIYSNRHFYKDDR